MTRIATTATAAVDHDRPPSPVGDATVGSLVGVAWSSAAMANRRWQKRNGGSEQAHEVCEPPDTASVTMRISSKTSATAQPAIAR